METSPHPKSGGRIWRWLFLIAGAVAIFVTGYEQVMSFALNQTYVVKLTTGKGFNAIHILAVVFLLTLLAMVFRRIVRTVGWVNRFCGWLFSWRTARRALVGFAVLVTLVAIFYAEENWRGKRAWDNYVRAQAAKGEKLDFFAFIPPPVPDDQNFCMCPLLKPIMDFRRTNAAPVDALRPWLIRKGWWPNITNGLIGWQNYYRSLTNLSDIPLTNSPAVDVLLALRRCEPDLAELKREAARRPLDRWPIQYDANPHWGILMPHLSHVKGICSLLQLYATAHLATGDSESAVSDLELGFRIANSLRSEPSLVSHLVRNSCHNLLLQPLKEGLEQHQFSEAQLGTLQRELRSADLLAGYQPAIRSERLLGKEWAEMTWAEIVEFTNNVSSDFNQPLLSFGRFARVAPKGLIYQNQLTLCRLYDDYVLPAVDIQTRTVYPKRAEAVTSAIKQAKGPYSMLVHLEFGSHSFSDKPASWPSKFAYSQTQIDEALIACALERYRLARGDYPETLNALVPQFIEKLPHDLIGGQPLKYHRTASGKYLLYSIGWNETDDGGITVRNKDGAEDREKGDWVWGAK